MENMRPEFFLAGMKAQVAEKYCWAITQAAGRSYCGRSDSSLVQPGFQLDCLVYTHIVGHIFVIYSVHTFAKFDLSWILPNVTTA